MNDFSRREPAPSTSPARRETVTFRSGPGRPSGSAACRNEGCLRNAPPGEPLCETCDLERSLYRREERFGLHGRTPSGTLRE